MIASHRPPRRVVITYASVGELA